MGRPEDRQLENHVSPSHAGDFTFHGHNRFSPHFHLGNNDTDQEMLEYVEDPALFDLDYCCDLDNAIENYEAAPVPHQWNNSVAEIAQSPSKNQSEQYAQSLGFGEQKNLRALINYAQVSSAAPNEFSNQSMQVDSSL